MAGGGYLIIGGGFSVAIDHATLAISERAGTGWLEGGAPRPRGVRSLDPARLTQDGAVARAPRPAGISRKTRERCTA